MPRQENANSKQAFPNLSQQNANLNWQNSDLPRQNDFYLLIFSFIV